MNAKYFLAVAAIALAASGCQRSVNLDTRRPAPLTPAPVSGVSSSNLPPATSPATSSSPASTDFPSAPETADSDPEAAAEKETQLAAAAPEVTRESLIGRWSVSTGGTSCDVFLALTKWTGGYRAASRGCAGTAAGVSAWDVQGKQVILSDNSGNQVARLYQSGNERYDGTTTSGQSISLSR
ncbi:protease inhibitor Inh/omp19 family protein [Pseudohoeflea coraliihabitans]|uniref:Outer membrane lipoprotein omp19 n=1 Tax=Pseudohoeflea coraliihabitans TaxID=2860393 RepID=A0ABS6WLC4_9HYPH|nr:protease inhibitor Inh/omp19 family protein [Pseudohoeflea sp. DP4N28-3]MBW3096754.1 protease inhibitor Inh/omp19 family protein [Pseudohoeflea sp. DP4N28-3]